MSLDIHNIEQICFSLTRNMFEYFGKIDFESRSGDAFSIIHILGIMLLNKYGIIVNPLETGSCCDNVHTVFSSAPTTVHAVRGEHFSFFFTNLKRMLEDEGRFQCQRLISI